MSALDVSDTTCIRKGPRWVFVGAVAIVLLLAAALRLDNLRALPVFIDESGHLYSALDYVNWPLADRVRHGKVLGYFVFYPMARYADDPLLAARTFMALSGVLTTLGVILLTRRLANSTTAIVSGVIWATMPYVVFHDRMALHDPLISLLVVWSTVGLAVGWPRNSWSLCGLAGVPLALAILTKVTAVLSVAVPLLVVVAPTNWPSLRQRVGALAAFVVLPGVAAMVMALGPLMGVQFGETFLRTGESMGWRSVWDGAMAAPTWMSEFNSFPFTLLVAVTILDVVFRPSKVKVGLLLSFVLAVVGHAVVLKVWFSRYLLPSLVPLVVLLAMVWVDWAGRAAVAISRRLREPSALAPISATAVAAALVVSFTPRWLDNNLAFARDPRSATMPPFDRYQYLDGWPSGYGLSEVVSFLNQQGRKSGKLLVLVGGFGRPGLWMLPLAAKVDPAVTVRSHHIFGRDQLVSAAEEAHRQTTFLVLEPPQYDVPEPLFSLVHPRPQLLFEYKRPDQGRWAVYALSPSTEVAVP